MQPPVDVGFATNRYLEELLVASPCVGGHLMADFGHFVVMYVFFEGFPHIRVVISICMLYL